MNFIQNRIFESTDLSLKFSKLIDFSILYYTIKGLILKLCLIRYSFIEILILTEPYPLYTCIPYSLPSLFIYYIYTYIFFPV